MIKKSRLSFRISDSLNDDIEKMVIIKRDVRDRSDLGNQSVEFFLDLIKNRHFEEEIFLNAIMKVAEKTDNQDLPEIKKLKETLDWFRSVSSDPITQSTNVPG